MLKAELSRNALLQQALPSLRRYARALARDDEAARDLVQDTVSRALERWSQWRGVGEPRPWLFAVMRSVHLSGARRTGKWRPILTDSPVEEAVGIDSTPGWLALRDVDAALARLAPEQREALLLVAVEGLSYAEAASVVGAPVGTVMSRLSRARLRLRALVDGTETDVEER